MAFLPWIATNSHKLFTTLSHLPAAAFWCDWAACCWCPSGAEGGLPPHAPGVHVPLRHLHVRLCVRTPTPISKYILPSPVLQDATDPLSYMVGWWEGGGRGGGGQRAGGLTGFIGWLLPLQARLAVSLVRVHQVRVNAVHAACRSQGLCLSQPSWLYHPRPAPDRGRERSNRYFDSGAERLARLLPLPWDFACSA